MSFETSHIRAQPSGRAASLRGTLRPAPAGIGIGGSPVGGFLVWLKLWLVVASRSETQRYIKNVLEGLPASRRYDRQLTGNQFHERACRLSVGGGRGDIRPRVPSASFRSRGELLAELDKLPMAA